MKKIFTIIAVIFVLSLFSVCYCAEESKDSIYFQVSIPKVGKELASTFVGKFENELIPSTYNVGEEKDGILGTWETKANIVEADKEYVFKIVINTKNKKLSNIKEFFTTLNGEYIENTKSADKIVLEKTFVVESLEEDNINVWSKASSWAVEELTKANKEGLIPATFVNEDFTKNISRKEFAHVAVKLYEKLVKKTAKVPANNPFTDTKDDEILKAYDIGITNGVTATEFGPDREITREQMATMIQRALDKAGISTKVDLSKVTSFTDDSQMHSWSRDAIYFMSENGVIKGISTKENRFGVKGTATIEQALLISIRSIDRFSH